MEWIDGGDHYGGAAWGMPDLDLPSVYTGLPCARSPAPGLDDVVEGSHTDYHDYYHEPWVVNPSPDFSAKSHADAANLETGTAGIHFSGMAAPPRLALHADEGEYEAIASPTPMRAARARVTSKATPLLKYADPNHAPVLSSAPRGALDLSRHINPEPSAASPRAKRQRRAAPKVEPEPPKARVQQPIVAHHHSKIVPPQAAAQATARALEEPVASRKKNRKPPTIPKSAAGLPMVCSYELCPNPLHTSGGTWKYVSSETRAGGRDWSPYEGMLFCNACFTQYATKGCMDRMGRQPVAGAVTDAPQAEAPPASPPKRKRKRLTKASSKERKRQSSSQAPAIVERSALA